MMNLKFKIISLLIVIVILISGCMAMNHKIGKGQQNNETLSARQWYALWGFVKVGEVNTSEMAGGVTNYEIKTYISTFDFFVNILTGYLSFYSRTIEVTK
ncbi:MAG: hypothetical protein ABIH42_04285 [Planctomycetota bacterium]